MKVIMALLQIFYMVTMKGRSSSTGDIGGTKAGVLWVWCMVHCLRTPGADRRRSSTVEQPQQAEEGESGWLVRVSCKGGWQGTQVCQVAARHRCLALDGRLSLLAFYRVP